MTQNQSNKRFFVLFMVLLFAGGLYSQSKITIKGKVLDSSDNTPMAGATVMVPSQSVGAMADEEGNYSITATLEEKVTVRVTYLGYDTSYADVNTEAGTSEYVLDFSIREEAVMGEEVVITAGRHEQKLANVPISMEVIKAEAVDLQATSNIEDVLQQSPGVDIMDGQANIRGSSGFAYGVGSRVMVMLDGLPLLSAEAGVAQFDMIPTDNITQVEIMKGASSVLYGSSAMGGVINVITGDAPAKPHTSIRLRGTLFDSPSNKALDWDGKKSAHIASLHAFHSRKIKNQDLVLQFDINNNSGYREQIKRNTIRGMVMTKFRTKKVPGLTFGLNGSFKADSSGSMLYWDSYLPKDTLVPILGSPIYDTHGGLSGNSALRRQLLFRYSVDPFISYLTPKGNVHNYRGRVLGTINTNDTDQESRNALFYNDYQFTTRIWKEKITWVSGVTGIFSTVNSDSIFSGSHFSMNGAAYTQMDAKFLDDRLNVSAGGRFEYVRFDNDPEQTSFQPIARLGVNYNTFPGNNIRASFGQAFRAPSVAERYTSTTGGAIVIVPNPNLRDEKGWSAEIGMRQGFKFGENDHGVFGYLDVAGYVMDYDDMIEFGLVLPESLDLGAILAGEVPPFSAINIADTRISGIEITGLVDGTFGDFGFALSGGVNWINPINKNPTPDSLQLEYRDDWTAQQKVDELLAWVSGVKADNPKFLKYRSSFMSRASFSTSYKRLFFTANFQQKSDMRNYDEFLDMIVDGLDTYVQEKGTAFNLFDLVLGYRLNDLATFSFHVDNLLNREYLVIPGLIGPQRNFSLQAKFTF